MNKKKIESILNFYKTKALNNNLFQEGKGYNNGAYMVIKLIEEKLK